MDIKKYVSVRKAVEITGLSEFFIRNSIRTGRVPVIKSGKKFMINLDKLNEYLARMEKGD